ncbi:MAG: hypothetical protein J6R18_00775 [Kiritimatiellae bacterium]|nr:hypothetical protein [Kiritimatiellia bacterium]
MEKIKKQILLVVGNDDYSAEIEVKQLISEYVPEEYRSSAIEIISGTASNADSQMASIRECTASLQTPPFLDPVKLTWWKDVNFLPGGGRGGKISDEVKDALEKLIDNLADNPLPENQRFVITASKLLKTSVFAKKAKSIAEIKDCSIPERSRDRAAAAMARLPELAKKENLSVSPGADRAFLAKTGPDTRTIASELSKMRTYLGEGNHTVTEADVAAITSVNGDEIEIWELTDALSSRNPARIISTLRNFQGDSGWAIMLSTVIERWFRDLIIAKSGGGGDDWKSRKNSSAASAFTLAELRLARYRMLTLREKLVSSQPADEYVEMEILRAAIKTR